MEHEQIGALVARRRKEKGLTQKQLAQHLGVTDKAVSKWERGLSCPDIALLLPLADALEVTPSELLAGQTADPAPSPQADQAAEEALSYAQRSAADKKRLARGIAFVTVTALALIAAVACVIPDLCLSGALTWSRIVLASLLLGWLVLLPFFFGEHPWRGACVMLTLAVFPYLWLLALLVGQPLVFRMGGLIALLGVIDLWLFYLFFSRLPILRALGLWCLCNTPTVWGINKIVSLFVRQAVGDRVEMLINTAALVGTALLCLLLDLLFSLGRSRRQQGGPDD